jgi:tetratricopeptide (TPR) repeat protein
MRTALWLAFWWVGGGLYQQAEEAQQAGQYAEAAQHWRTLANAVPEQRLAFQLNEAQALLSADSVVHAEQILERIAPALSTDSLRGARAYHLLGLARTRQLNRLRDAIEPLQKALRLNPADERARHNLELVLRRLPPPPPSPPIPPPVYEVERPSP